MRRASAEEAEQPQRPARANIASAVDTSLHHRHTMEGQRQSNENVRASLALAGFPGAGAGPQRSMQCSKIEHDRQSSTCLWAGDLHAGEEPEWGDEMR